MRFRGLNLEASAGDALNFLSDDGTAPMISVITRGTGSLTSTLGR
jgi:hypothetical protein